MNDIKRFLWRCRPAGSHFVGALKSTSLFTSLPALLLLLNFFAILSGGPTAAFGAIEEIKPLMEVTTDNSGIRLRFPYSLFLDDARGETYLVTGGRAQLTVFADDFFPLATAGPGRGLYTPQGGAIDRNGQVYIAQSARDGRPSRITVLNGAWIISREISFDQIPEARNFVPRRLAISHDGLIYVTSQARGVMVLDNDGSFLRWLQPRDKIRRPSAVASEPTEEEKSTSAPDAEEMTEGSPAEESPEVELIEESATESSGGPPDVEDNAGLSPVRIRAVTIDSGGNIYMVSDETGKIYVHGPDEAFLFSFGSKGGTPGRLSQPRGVAVDRERGLMYVVDYMRHTILTYDKEGTFLFEFGGKGGTLGWFQFPTDVAVNKHGQVIVADLFNHRLQVLEIRYQKEFPSLEELKRTAPAAKGTDGAEPADPAAESPDVPAGGIEAESAAPETPVLKPDVEVIEEVIPEQLPVTPDAKVQ